MILPTLFIHHFACKIIWISKNKLGIFSYLEKGDGPVQQGYCEKLRKWHVPRKKYVRKIQTYSWKWKFPIAYRYLTWSTFSQAKRQWHVELALGTMTVGGQPTWGPGYVGPTWGPKLATLCWWKTTVDPIDPLNGLTRYNSAQASVLFRENHPPVLATMGP